MPVKPTHRPVCLGGRTHRVKRFSQLVNVRLARQKRHAQDELDENGAHGPNVDGGAIVARPKKELRRSVPPGISLSYPLLT
jgi:hypothetical protein